MAKPLETYQWRRKKGLNLHSNCKPVSSAFLPTSPDFPQLLPLQLGWCLRWWLGLCWGVNQVPWESPLYAAGMHVINF